MNSAKPGYADLTELKRWIEATNAVGITSKSGRYGGTYAHQDIAKVNYHIQTEAIKDNLIPKDLSKSAEKFIYASEADLLNLALFSLTA